MSYNKLKSLVANVEAIETAMKIQVQGRQPTAEEKEILSRYSGFGGIKEVLNIGTDKPISGDMQEPIQRLQELINAYPHFTEPMRHNVIEGIKASVLTAFYTPKFLVDAVVRQIHATFSENGLKMRSFLEPSAGIGGFLPIAMSGTYDYAIEKDLISGMILSLLHENTLTRTAAFETIGEQGFEHTTFDVIASNIPFGNFRVFDAELWKKGGMYEQATKTIHNYFFVKAMELLNEGGLLAFITSRGIADTPGNKFVREYLVNHADLISAIRLPDMLFMQTSGIEVGSDLLIFQKHTHKTVLSQREQLFLQVGREKADAIGTMTEYANKLFTMPKTTLATGSRIVQNQYGKYVRKYQWQGNENAMSQYLAALLKLDFGRYFRKSLFTGNGQGSEHMQMSLFGNVAMKQVEKGKRAYTDGVEAWMKDGAMVLFEGQVGTIQYRKSSLYQEVAIDFVPVDEGKVNTDRAKDYFPIRKAYFELSIKEREEQKEDNGLRRELNARYDAFVAKWGCFHENDNKEFIMLDSLWKIQCKLPPKTKRFCPLKTFNNAPLKSLDRWGYYYFSLFPSVCSHFTDTFSCQLNPVRRMYNTIHNGICYCRVSDCIIPIVRWQLRGDDDGLAPMSVLYYIEQDGSFLGIKVHKEEVIQYEQRAPFDSLEFRFQCAFYFCHLKRTHKFRSIRIICPYALLAGFIPHCCGKEALPGTG